MQHHILSSRPESLLFRTTDEALAAWHAVLGVVDGLHALCVLPNQIHVLCDREQRATIAASVAPLTQMASSLPTPVGPDEVDDTVCRIHRLPCEEGLCIDPLAWPFSTHRDACGLALPSVIRRRDPAPFHHMVSATPAQPEGTKLPRSRHNPHPMALVVAVSALRRESLLDLSAISRSLLIMSLREVCGWTNDDIRRAGWVTENDLTRPSLVPPFAWRVVARAARDKRFRPLGDAGPVLTDLPS